VQRWLLRVACKYLRELGYLRTPQRVSHGLEEAQRLVLEGIKAAGEGTRTCSGCLGALAEAGEGKDRGLLRMARAEAENAECREQEDRNGKA
jgi:hypothetical protein